MLLKHYEYILHFSWFFSFFWVVVFIFYILCPFCNFYTGYNDIIVMLFLSIFSILGQASFKFPFTRISCKRLPNLVSPLSHLSFFLRYRLRAGYVLLFLLLCSLSKRQYKVKQKKKKRIRISGFTLFSEIIFNISYEGSFT